MPDVVPRSLARRVHAAGWRADPPGRGRRTDAPEAPVLGRAAHAPARPRAQAPAPGVDARRGVLPETAVLGADAEAVHDGVRAPVRASRTRVVDALGGPGGRAAHDVAPVDGGEVAALGVLLLRAPLGPPLTVPVAPARPALADAVAPAVLLLGAEAEAPHALGGAPTVPSGVRVRTGVGRHPGGLAAPDPAWTLAAPAPALPLALLGDARVGVLALVAPVVVLLEAGQVGADAPRAVLLGADAEAREVVGAPTARTVLVGVAVTRPPEHGPPVRPVRAPVPRHERDGLPSVPAAAPTPSRRRVDAHEDAGDV